MTSVEDTVDRRTVEDLAHSVVAEIAPSELETFPLVAEAFFAQKRRLPARRRLDDRLGVGIELANVVATMTPVALLVANEAAKALVGEVTKSSAKTVGRRVVATVRGWRRRHRTSSSTEPVGASERARLLRLAIEHGLSEQDAVRLVDAVLERRDSDE